MPPAADAADLPVHISVLTLDVSHLDAGAETRDVHRMHARVARLFDAVPAFDGGRPLWALPRADVLVIQGPVPVTAAHLPHGYILHATHRPVAVPAAGTPVTAHLIANPTRAPRDATCRQALPPGERDAWLARKLDGALTLDAAHTGGRPLSPATGRGTGARTITLTRHAFHARGTVADQVALARMMLGGVGAGKGYGCGLLIVTACAR